jgi:predicted small lipoprotein YifL
LIGFLAASPRRRKWVFVALAALGLALSACGRNGDPMPPPDASAAPEAKSSDSLPSFGRPSNPPIAKPRKPFVLDPLL